MTVTERVWRLRSEAVSWQEADGEVIALDLTTSDYLGVNSSGALLWTRLAKGATAAELTTALVAAFGVDQERAGTDVAAFLDDAGHRGLLEG